MGLFSCFTDRFWSSKSSSETFSIQHACSISENTYFMDEKKGLSATIKELELPGDRTRKIDRYTAYTITCPNCHEKEAIRVHYFKVFDGDVAIASGLVFKQSNAQDVFFEVPFVTIWSTHTSRGLEVKSHYKGSPLTGKLLSDPTNSKKWRKGKKPAVECGQCSVIVLDMYVLDFKVDKDCNYKNMRGTTIKVLAFSRTA